MSVELLINLAIATPAVGTILILLTGRYPNLRETVTLLTAILLFVQTVLISQTDYINLPSHSWIEPLDGLAISFKIDPLGMLFALVSSFLWIVTSIFSIGYMRGNNEQHQTRFYACFAIAMSSTIGIAFSANMFSLFIFYEMLTLSTYPLVTHSGSEKARLSGRQYLGYLLGTSIGFQLFAIIWTWNITGTLDFRNGGIFEGQFSQTLITILFVLYVLGIGKAALMPFHRWLPAAMVAPTPVSALLHAVAVVKAGVFTFMKVTIYIFGIEILKGVSGMTVLFLSATTIIIASIVALTRDNLKARLAYSTISQLSYVIMATALLAPLSIIGAAVHIAAHAFGKITLFFAAGSIYTASGKTEVSQLNGIGHQMPLTMTAFTIGTLSMIGIPPTAGFLSKWFILQGAFNAESWIVIGVLVVSTLLNAAYFLPIVFAAFFRAPAAGKKSDIREAPLPILIALGISAFGTVLLFVIPDTIVTMSRMIIV